MPHFDWWSRTERQRRYPSSTREQWLCLEPIPSCTGRASSFGTGSFSNSDPDFPSGPIDPGGVVSGLFFFEVPETTAVDAILFAPSRDRLIDLTAPAAANSTPNGDFEDGQDGGSLPQPDVGALQGAGMFTSTVFGHRVSWDPALWSPVAASTERHSEILGLDGDVASVRIDALARPDPHSCLQDQVGLDLDHATGFDTVPADVLAPTADGTAAPAGGLYSLSIDTPDARSGELIRYVECRTLVDGRAVLRIVASVPRRFWAIERDSVTDLLSSIELPIWAVGPSDGRAAVPSTDLPDVPTVRCRTLLTTELSLDALSIRERTRAGEESSMGGYASGEVCEDTLDADGRVFVRLEPGDQADFAQGARLLGSTGEPIPGIGDAALLFRSEDTDTGLSVLAVTERRDLGDLRFRVLLGRPDLDGPTRTLQLARLGREYLGRMPGQSLSASAVPGLATSLGAAGDRDDPSKLSYVGNLLAKEDAGEWTRGEGLTATLALFEGTASADEVLRHAEVQQRETTGILRMAHEFIDSEQGDEETVSEIARLTDVLEYSDVELELMAGIRSRAIASIGGLSASGHVGPTELCQRFHHGWVGPGVGPCLEWRPANVPGEGLTEGKYRVFIPAPSVPQEGWSTKDYDNALTALEWSARWFERDGVTAARAAGAVGRMPAVDLIFSVSAGSPALAQASAAEGKTCAVVLYPVMQTVSANEFQQTIAHELGHCFQQENFPAQNRVAYDIVDWREEGLAEYLSNAIYPQNNVEWAFWWGDGESITSKKTIVDLSYGNFLFFQYLEKPFGLAGIMSLVNSLPTTRASGLSDQANAIVTFGDMKTLLHEYGQAMVDGSVADSGGGNFPHLLEYQTLNVTEPVLLNLTWQPLGVGRLQLVVEECKVASLETEVGSATSSVRPEDAQDWGEPPRRLPETSEAPLDLIVLVTAVSATDVVLGVADLEDDLRLRAR